MADYKVAAFNGIKLAYKQWSTNGKPLVFLHGMLESALSWDIVAPFFLANFKVYAIDLRGHGLSSKPETGFRWNEDFSNDVTSFIIKEIAEETILVGHSLGSMVAAAVAANHPEFVSALILEDPPAFDQSEVFPFFEDRLKLRLLPYDKRVQALQTGNTTSEQTIQGANSLETVHPAVLHEFINGKAHYDSKLLFPNIECPTLLMVGDKNFGSVVAPYHIDLICSQIKNVTVSKWRNVGHGIHDLEPEKFSKAIIEFINLALTV
jgi:non-heme chloroperoxidase